MYPGLSDTDWQVAMIQHRQLVAEGQYQQFVASNLATATGHGLKSATIRQFGTLLVRAGQRLQGAHSVTKNRLGSVVAGERGAMA